MGFVVLLAAILTAGPAAAEFTKITDFEDLSMGPIDDQDGWYAEDVGSTVAPDPTYPGNQVLSIKTESTHLHRPLPLPEGATRMLFLRFRFEDQLSLTSATSELRINDDGFYSRRTSTASSSSATARATTWSSSSSSRAAAMAWPDPCSWTTSTWRTRTRST